MRAPGPSDAMLVPWASSAWLPGTGRHARVALPCQGGAGGSASLYMLRPPAPRGLSIDSLHPQAHPLPLVLRTQALPGWLGAGAGVG